ncbi:MAG: acylphosphatase [Bacteriovoracia bacterium]
MLEMRLNIKGKVQKVGFRWSVVQFVKNEGLAVTGHVINLPDGSVELIAQGDIESLKRIHRFATKGPERAEVREVTQEIVEIPEQTYREFSID